MLSPTSLRRLNPRRTLAWAALAYAGLLAAGAVVGSEVALRSKTRRVKGAFVPVRRQGDALWLPALPETLPCPPAKRRVSRLSSS